MKTAVVTGAFGFAGVNLTQELIQNGYKVYGIGRKRPTASHNDRLKESDCLVKIFLEMEEYDRISEYIHEDVDVFFHLAWGGGRDDLAAQKSNIEGAVKALEAAAKLPGKTRFVGIGSQAEYGVKSDVSLITENMKLEPFSAYGSCKVEAYHLLKEKAQTLGVDFIWGRIFSLIGKYEPSGRMLPDLVHKLMNNEEVNLSSCEQYWDYLDAADAARAMIALGERGVAGEEYNIANGDFRPLKEYVLEAAKYLGADPELIHFGKAPEPFISLKPSVEKIKRDTGWTPQVSFVESLEFEKTNNDVL